MKKFIVAFAITLILVGGLINAPKAEANFAIGDALSLFGIGSNNRNHSEYMSEIMLEEVSNGHRIWSHRQFTATVPFGYAVEYLQIGENRTVEIVYAKAGTVIKTNSLIYKSVGLADRKAEKCELNVTQLYNLNLIRLPDGRSTWENDEMVDIEVPKGISVYYWGSNGVRFHLDQTGGVIKAFRVLIYDKSNVGK
jgi:hypothetical protein